MPVREAITVGIIEDNRLAREAITAMLNELPDVQVVTSPDADPAFLAETKPYVMLLDEGLGDHDSLRAAAALKNEMPDAKIIVMDFVPVNEDIIREADGQKSELVLEDVRMTRREREVIELIGAGLWTKKIAQRLSIATHTVKSHVRNVMEKLAVHTRLQIAAYSHSERAAQPA